MVGCRLVSCYVFIPPVHTVRNTTLRLACYKRYALASPTRSRRPSSESSVNNQCQGRRESALFLAHQGAAVPSTGSGAGTASSATPSQSSKGSLEPPCSSLDPGVLASISPIGPAGLLHFTCSTHVAPGERFFCMLAMRRPWFDDGEPSTKRLFLCFLCARVESTRSTHFSHGCP